MIMGNLKQVEFHSLLTLRRNQITSTNQSIGTTLLSIRMELELLLFQTVSREVKDLVIPAMKLLNLMLLVLICLKAPITLELAMMVEETIPPVIGKRHWCKEGAQKDPSIKLSKFLIL